MKQKFSLSEYTAAAIALLCFNSSKGQVTYWDIDPDTILEEDDDYFEIDLDDDGVIEFSFHKASGTATLYSSEIVKFIDLIAEAKGEIGNGIAGSASIGSGYSNYFPYVIEAGELINNSLPFYHFGQTLVLMHDDIDSIVDPTHQGNWYHFDGTPVTEKFVGFRWKQASDVRYGWVRCSVIDSGRTLVLHDYAVEMEVNKPILAGDTIGYVGINNNLHHNHLQLTFADNDLAIYYPFKSHAELSIIDISGKIVHTSKIFAELTHINTTAWHRGVYLVVVNNGETIEQAKCLVQ